MSENFTPGPWSVADNGGIFITSDCGEICQIEGNGTIEGNDLSNAHLMAASPELYNALKCAAGIIGHPDDTMSKHFQTILAKARGE